MNFIFHKDDYLLIDFKDSIYHFNELLVFGLFVISYSSTDEYLATKILLSATISGKLESLYYFTGYI